MFDHIGSLVIPARHDAEGAETHPEVIYSSWHVNCSPDEIDRNPTLVDYVIKPSPLQRVVHGDSRWNPTMTVALRFTDEAEAHAVIGG
jgi:hypothetical protein